MNGDGKPDLAGTGLVIDQNTDGSTVGIYFNNSPMGFVVPGEIVPGGSRPFDIQTADINHDGQPDLIVTNPQFNDQSHITLLLNQSGGVFPTMNAPSYAAGYGSILVATGDLNGDGLADLVASTAGSQQANVPAQVIVYLNATP